MARMQQDTCGDCPAAAYLRRKPENLVVNGYRNWVAGLAHSDSRYWDAAWSAHASALGAIDGGHALDVMAALVRQLGACATCPLRFYKPGAGHLCRDECLVLGMVAGAQNGDEQAMVQSARMLTCTDACADVVDRASAYAAILLGHSHKLTPIPLSAIVDINVRSTLTAAHMSASLH
ncbi:hypothetical protein IMCC20628_03504 [Hoeflea sp. IMCC20628]|uniref:hypothetical protein n=1 Tax=Hoeflea sp. IMCC20628 TaxID=1620421 RepID=UPI00063BE44B|nr:hypothetical protein [Hoeflea sp. IMCC20628]AKI02193.1 hypothetical protein IMCC20628_03504 [Hoeflea sp. IMCC20628]